MLSFCYQWNVRKHNSRVWGSSRLCFRTSAVFLYIWAISKKKETKFQTSVSHPIWITVDKTSCICVLICLVFYKHITITVWQLKWIKLYTDVTRVCSGERDAYCPELSLGCRIFALSLYPLFSLLSFFHVEFGSKGE